MPLGIAYSQTSSKAESGPANFTLSLNARLVILDVAITDSGGNPVEGLTAKDFKIYEDGKLQRIRSVEPPSEHSMPAATIAAGITATFDPGEPASFGRSPVNVLVLDQLNTHFADSSFARRSLHDYLAAQSALLVEPTTLLTLADNGFKTAHAFTRDRDALLRALDATPPEYAWKLEVNGKADYGPVERLDQSLRALEEIAESYRRIPGRKNLIWVGGGFPTIDPTTIDRGDAQEVKDTLQHVTDILLDARVTVYAVDPSNSAAGMSEITDSTQLEFAELAGDALSGNFDPFGATDDFDRLGPITGGSVLRGKNDVAQQIAAVVERSARFYTIAYTPNSTSEASAQFRKIRVVCARPGLNVSSRTGYFTGQTEGQHAAATAAYDLSTAAESTIPLNALHVVAEPSEAADAPPHTYIVRANIADLTWKAKPDGTAVASVYIMAASLSPRKKMISHTLQGMTATAKQSVDLHAPDKAADFVFTAVPSRKAATLRFVVRDSATGRMGIFDLPVTGQRH
jgi:VWFA-related protein